MWWSDGHISANWFKELLTSSGYFCWFIINILKVYAPLA